MSKLRSVNTHFWSDNYIIELDPTDKLLFLYLLTNDQTNMLGIYELHIRKISFDTGIKTSTIREIFDRFNESGKASYVKGFVVLHNFIKHQRMNDNMKKSAVSAFKDLPKRIRTHSVVSDIRNQLSNLSDYIQNVVVSLSRREALYVKYRGVCQYCNNKIEENTNLEIDHVNPLSKGGSDTYDNIVLSCRKCNQEKLDKKPEDLGWERPSTGSYHFNIARKDLSEVEWLREDFNSVFNRKLRSEDGELVDVNHKHTINNPLEPIAEIESEVEGELEEEIETENNYGGAKYSIDSKDPWDKNQPVNYESFVGWFNETSDANCRMSPNKPADIKKQLKTFTGIEIKQALYNRALALRDSEYLSSWESIFTRKPERMEKYLNLKTENLNKNGHKTRGDRQQEQYF